MSYSFSSKPQAVAGTRIKAKYRDRPRGGSNKFEEEEEQKTTMNLMADRRIMRGNTYGKTVKPLESLESQYNKAQIERNLARSSALVRQKQRIAQEKLDILELAEQEKRKARKTPAWSLLEEIPAPPVSQHEGDDSVYEAETTVEATFVPLPEGRSVATSLGDGEVFDFDEAVTPILQVLVGKSLDEGLMEVLEEEEEAEREEARLVYRNQRGSIQAGAQRLQSEMRRRQDEMNRRYAQEASRARAADEEAHRLAARSVAASIMDDMEVNVLEKMKEEGLFYDDVRRQVESVFIPWLETSVAAKLTLHTEAQRQLLQVVVSAVAGAQGAKPMEDGKQK